MEKKSLHEHVTDHIVYENMDVVAGLGYSEADRAFVALMSVSKVFGPALDERLTCPRR